jgi:hypothetical protein
LKAHLVSFFALTISVLSGCGGGGGGGGGGAPSKPQNLDPQASSINTTYQAAVGLDTESTAMVNRINAERQACGFGALRQNGVLDAVARNHADWQLRNFISSHSEVFGSVGFTGVDANARAVFAGYNNGGGLVISDEFVDLIGSSNKAGRGEASMRLLLVGPYHQIGMLRGFRDIGVSVRNNVDVGVSGSRVIAQVDVAYTSSDGDQLLGTSEVVTYPCQGVSGVAPRMTGEVPSVSATRDYAVNPTGQPIVVMGRAGQSISVTSAFITETASGASVPVAMLTSANDRNGLFRSNEVAIIPDVALSTFTSYSVSINGSNSGVPFSRNFSFTTGQ